MNWEYLTVDFIPFRRLENPTWQMIWYGCMLGSADLGLPGDSPSTEMNQALDALGRSGWELVSVFPMFSPNGGQDASVKAILRRALPGS